MTESHRFTHQLEIGRWLMACQFDVLLNQGLPVHGPEAAIDALDVAQHMESLLSVYLPQSEFSQINRSETNVLVSVSAATLQLLQIAEEVRAETAGAFNIAAASLSDLWGFSRRQGEMPTSSQIESAVNAIASEKIVINAEQRQVARTSQDIRINSGGIGKGYALDRMAYVLKDREVTDFLVHGGHSSILAAGNRYDVDSHDGWRIAVRHPEQQQIILGELRLRDIGLGTSGPANQFFYFKGVRYGHIIDPRTGWPFQACCRSQCCTQVLPRQMHWRLGCLWLAFQKPKSTAANIRKHRCWLSYPQNAKAKLR